MKHKVISIELNDKQNTRYTEWMSGLKAVFGTSGYITWTITYNGIGENISVCSSHAPNHPLDLTDIDSW